MATDLTNMAPTFPDPLLFTGGATGLSVRENATGGTLVGTAPQATDPESRPLSYSLAVPSVTGDPPFVINATSRQIRVAQGAALDHEGPDATYNVTVTATDEFNAKATADFDITIEDVNERPVAVPDPSVRTDEDTPATFDVLANDTDPELDTLTVMTITTQPRRRARGGGKRHADADLHAGRGRPRHVHVHVHRLGRDAHQPSRPGHGHRRGGERRAHVRAVAPALSVSESAVGGDIVGAVTATDVERDPLTYSLSGADAASFVIDQDSGQITVAAGVTFDIVMKPTYTVTVTATESATPSLTATVEVTITVVPGPVAPPPSSGGGGGGFVGGGEAAEAAPARA